jgi:(4S)-4-hydroxy-5-phosphonooxypentane-2,3-dione isomerase
MAGARTAASNGKFVITVLFTVKPEAKDAFRAAVVENAVISLEREAGCEVFDVCESSSAPEFFLYEVYHSEKDFQEHLETEHFKQFDKLCPSWVTGKHVTPYAKLRLT